ncbi:HNH endonuclease [Mesorhizobium sp. BHbsci]
MARSVKEWIGKTDNTKAPPRVCQRVFDRDNGICHFCGQPIQPGQKVETDHIQALINGGENRETNLAPIHKKPCHTIKTAADVADKAKVAAVRKKHSGITKPAGKLRGPAFALSEKAVERANYPSKQSLPPRTIFRGPGR